MGRPVWGAPYRCIVVGVWPYYVDIPYAVISIYAWICEGKGVGVFITRTRIYTIDCIYKYIFMKHLKDNNVTYWYHWRFAMKVSLALFIHAWFPNVLEDYASNKLCGKK